MSHASINSANKTQTWTSLVDEMMSKLEGNGIPWNTRQILKEKFREMAKMADLHTSHVGATKHLADTLMDRIIETARPKYCGDTSVILGAKVKIAGLKGEDEDLNGFIGVTRHPFHRGYNATGMVGVKLYPGQKVPVRIERNEINIDANNVIFIE